MGLEPLWIAMASAERDLMEMGVAVWRCTLPDVHGAQLDEAVHLGWLTQDERAAADRRIGATAQSRFASRRILRRLVVASVLGTAPADVRLESRCRHCGGVDHGAPSVVRPDGTGLHVSTASLDSTTVIALSRHVVGVDVESVSRANDVGAARMAGALPGWRHVVGACRPEAPAVEVWTAFEALCKVTGRGLLASEREIDRAVQEHRLHWFADRPDSVVCVATAAAESTITLVDVLSDRAVR